MIKCKNPVISLAIIVVILIPSIAVFVDANPVGISFNEDLNDIIITTNYITIKIAKISPHFIWWVGNQSSSNEMYNVKFISIKEFFGDDDFLDNPLELGGISYDLASSDWSHQITMNEASLTIEFTLTGLANGAEIQFILNIYNENQMIQGTDHLVNALTEMKFDIVINNWEFTENASGLAFLTNVFESQQNHRMNIRDGTLNENGNASQSMQIESEEYHDNKIAFFEWTNFASIYDGLDLVNNISVSKASLLGDIPVTLPIDLDIIPLYLTYPNYGNSLKMVHDPLIGVYPESFSHSFNAISIVSGIIAFVIIGILTSKRNRSFKGRNKRNFLNHIFF